MTSRRQFISLLGGAAAAWPVAVRGQQSERLRRVGVLMALAGDDSETNARMGKFYQELERLGWSQDRNIRINARFAAGKPDEFQVLAKELIAFQPDVILAHSTPAVAALKQQNRTIPIVFVSVGDPVGSGFIASLARPGGNLTGLLLYEESIVGKWLTMLKEIAPRLTTVGLLGNPKAMANVYEGFLRSAKANAQSLSLELVPGPVEDAADIKRTIQYLANIPDAGLVLPPDTTTILHRDLIIELAARHRLPAVYQASFWVEAGGLMSYGTDLADQLRQAASYVDRILRGDKPADLPVQAPTKYTAAINLKTAKALGLEVPPMLLVRADEVIE